MKIFLKTQRKQECESLANEMNRNECLPSNCLQDSPRYKKIIRCYVVRRICNIITLFHQKIQYYLFTVVMCLNQLPPV